LTIAGSDPSGGAGIQADLRMFGACRTFGTTVITALTAQNPYGVEAVKGLEAEFVGQQLDSLLSSLPIMAIKTGMLWSAEIVELIAEKLPVDIPLVVDPVMVSTSGAKLISEMAIESYCVKLLPRCTLATPNLDEAEVLLGGRIVASNQELAARTLYNRFGCPILLKGGHLEGDPRDILFDGTECRHWSHKRIKGINSHGTGCMLSAAITAHLAHGNPLSLAVEKGLKAVHTALSNPVTLEPSLLLAGIENIFSNPQ
jgi:hydroxymethylpyrimidine/phosphomethylpyrimidine kinase